MCGHVAVVVVGIVMFVSGLLMAGHAPFQNWRYSNQWHNPDRKGPVDVNSKDNKMAVANMKITGGGLISNAANAIFLGFVIWHRRPHPNAVGTQAPPSVFILKRERY